MLDIQTLERDGVTIVKLKGRLDSETSQAADARLQPVQAQAMASWVLDLTEVTFVSSAGIRVVLTAAKLCRSHGGDLYLAGLSPQVMQVFRISGLLGFLHVSDTPDAAAAAIVAARG